MIAVFVVTPLMFFVVPVGHRMFFLRTGPHANDSLWNDFLNVAGFYVGYALMAATALSLAHTWLIRRNPAMDVRARLAYALVLGIAVLLPQAILFGVGYRGVNLFAGALAGLMYGLILMLPRARKPYSGAQFLHVPWKPAARSARRDRRSGRPIQVTAMDTQRREFYRDFFKSELAAVSEQPGSGPRLRWLAEHLEEYVDRWLGFCALAVESNTSVVTAPGFYMIELGREALAEEFAGARMPPDVEAAWRDFASALSKVRDRGGLREAEQLGVAARQVLSTVVSNFR